MRGGEEVSEKDLLYLIVVAWNLELAKIVGQQAYNFVALHDFDYHATLFYDL